jgi:hypothetical protein
MRYVPFMRRLPLSVVDLVFIALLIPAPVHRAHAVARDLLNVLTHVGKIEGRIVIRRRGLFNLAAHEGERQAGKSKVLRNAPRVICFLRLLQAVRRVQRRAPIRRGACDHGHGRILALAARRRLIWMQHPLRLACLAADHGNRIGRRRPDDGVHEVVKEREPVRVAPEKRRRVAVHVAHHQLAKLLALQRRRLGRLAIFQRHALFGQRILRVLRHAVRIQRHLARKGHMRVIHRCDIRRINRHLLAGCIDHRRRNPERRNCPHRSVGVDNRLRKSNHLVVRIRSRWSCVEPVRSWVAAEIKIKGSVILKEHKNVFDPAANQPQLLFL